MKTELVNKLGAAFGLYLLIFGIIPAFAADGNALALDGVNDYASVADNNSLDLGTVDGQGFTIEAWFYVPDLNGEGLQTLIYKQNAYALFINFHTNQSDDVFFRVWGSPLSTDYYTLGDSANISVGWHHIAAVFDNHLGGGLDTRTVYLDGTSIASSSARAFNPGINGSSSTLDIGAYFASNPFHGWIDEVRLSDAVRYIGPSYMVPSAPFLNDSNTRALWHFNEGTGATTFADSSGNGNNLSGNSGAQTGTHPLVGLPGSLDLSFDPGAGAIGVVYTVAAQSDGKILIGGSFTTPLNRVARLLSNGSLDSGFNPGVGANSTVYSIAVQRDGKVLIGGAFTNVGGVLRNGIARLNSDGGLDASLDPGGGVTGGVFGNVPAVRTIGVQSSGKIIVGGVFTSVNGTPYNHLARLNTNGTLDTTFNTGSGPDFYVYSVAVEGNDRIVIGGIFSNYGQAPRNHIARLYADGTLDPSFDPNPNSGTGVDAEIRSVALRPDGNVIIGGVFTSINSVPRNHVAELRTDGSLDPTFNPSLGANDIVFSVAAGGGNKVLIGGLFTSVNGMTRGRIARLNSDGSLDFDFDTGSGADFSVLSVLLQLDGRLLIGGGFTSVNGASRNRIARLNGDVLLFNPVLDGNTFRVSFATSSGNNYTLEFKETFTQTNWTSASTISGDGTVKQLIDPTADSLQRYYRIRVD